MGSSDRDDTAGTGASAAVGFNGRRVVVGLDLEGDPVLLVQADHAGVVVEYRQAVVAV